MQVHSTMQYTAELHEWTKFISVQDQYSLTQREEEWEMLVNPLNASSPRTRIARPCFS
jgi:hypothetical protein